jgi:hypothetical protein
VPDYELGGREFESLRARYYKESQRDEILHCPIGGVSSQRLVIASIYINIVLQYRS